MRAPRLDRTLWRMSAGWYQDPSGRFEQRYFDGTNWTMSVAGGGHAFLDTTVEPTKVNARPWAITALVGGGLSAIAAFLPWAKVNVIFFTSTLSGIEGDGVLTLIAGAVVMVLAFIQSVGQTRNDKWPCVVNLLFGLGIIGVASYELVDYTSNGAGIVEPGSGLYLTAIAGVVVLVGAIGGLTRAK